MEHLGLKLSGRRISQSAEIPRERMALCTLDWHQHLTGSHPAIAGSLPSTATQDPLTLGAMSEDAWKEVRLPLGLKELLGFFQIKGMSPIWAQETGHIWWTFSVSGRGHKLTTTFVRQVNSGLDVRCWSWSVSTSFALPYKSRVRLAAMELEVPKASQATPFFLRFEPSKAPRPWLHLSLFHQVRCVCFFLNSEETNSFWIRQLIIIPHPSLKKDANTQKIINESSMNHDIQWAFNCCNWGFYVCAFDPRTKFSPPKQDGQKMLVGPVQRRRCQRMEQIGWMDGKTGETNKNAMRCLES